MVHNYKRFQLSHPVISLYPTQKAQIARKLRKPRFNQYHMLFYLFMVTFLPKQGLWVPTAVNSMVFMFQLCWAVSWHVVKTNIIITNLVLWTGQREEGTGHSHFLSSPKVFPQLSKDTGRYESTLAKRHLILSLIELQECYRLGRRSGT